MRKLLWLSGLALALGLSACVAATDSVATVADGTRAEPLVAQSAAPGFVDQDGDGVCDHRQQAAAGRGPGFVDQNGDGICDRMQAPSP